MKVLNRGPPHKGAGPISFNMFFFFKWGFTPRSFTLFKNLCDSVKNLFGKPAASTEPSNPYTTYGEPYPVAMNPLKFEPTQVIPPRAAETTPAPIPIKDMPKKSWGVVVVTASPSDVPEGTKVLRVSGNYFFAAQTPKWSSNRKVKNYMVRPLTTAELAYINDAIEEA